MAVGVAQYNLSICSKILVGVQWSQFRHKRGTTGMKKCRLSLHILKGLPHDLTKLQKTSSGNILPKGSQK
jgi:hypothetical protein